MYGLTLVDLDTTLLFIHHHPILFFFNDTATTEIYTLSLHDALPISSGSHARPRLPPARRPRPPVPGPRRRAGRLCGEDRKSTRLNSSHPSISYAVFCLKKKKNVLNWCSLLSYSACHSTAGLPSAASA